jgi:hypothetical protein
MDVLRTTGVFSYFSHLLRDASGVGGLHPGQQCVPSFGSEFGRNVTFTCK